MPVRERGLHVIAKSRLMEFANKHGDCKSQVIAWYNIASKATCHNLSEVRQTFPQADVVGGKTVFNIKGNAYRLVVHILYERQRIYIKHLLTHSEYDKDNWKN
jgi:mRNA interferase HigB